MKNCIFLQYIFIIFIILFILRQLLVVPCKQFFAIFLESRNQTYDLFPLQRRNHTVLGLFNLFREYSKHTKALTDVTGKKYRFVYRGENRNSKLSTIAYRFHVSVKHCM